MSRVTPAVAIATILLCGAAGAALGSLFPLDSLKRYFYAPPETTVVLPVATTADDTASSPVPSVPKEAPATTTVVPPMAATTDDLASSAVPREAPAFRDERETPGADPQPEVLADTTPSPPQGLEPVDKHHVGSPPAPPKETGKVEHARTATTATKKSRPATRSHAKREAATREETPPKRSIISQLPIIGPVIGLVVP